MKLTHQNPRTLLEMAGDAGEFAVEDAALLLIDYQNEYLRGQLPLAGMPAVIEQTERLLEWARRAGRPVIHVLHRGGGGLFDLDSDGGRPIATLAPTGGETVVYKTLPDAFVETELRRALEAAAPGRQVVVAGLMSHMCLTATTIRMLELGFRPLIFSSTTTTRGLRGPTGETIPALQITAAALAALQDRYALLRSDLAILDGGGVGRC